MGWLVGRENKNNIEIVDAYVGNCKSNEHYTQLDVRETIKFNNLAKKRNLKLIGQWHSHPHFGTHPSSTDITNMNDLKQFGIKTPIMLIVNSNNFWLGTTTNFFAKELDFVIPQKLDNNLDLNLNTFVTKNYQLTEQEEDANRYSGDKSVIDYIAMVIADFVDYIEDFLTKAVRLIGVTKK